ncbi:MAG: hypothetical protein ACYC6Y_29825 [Thermoguttaceae bacterium]
MAIDTIVAANRSGPRARIQWRALAAVLLFVATCLAYYLACRRLGLATEWAFLMGFLPSWPLAVPAACRLTQRAGPLEALAWVAGAFSLYFWSVGAFLLWQAARV